MPTVAELKTLIRAYKGDECPFTSKMKKAELLDFAMKKKLLSDDEINKIFNARASPEARAKKIKKAKEGKIVKAPSAYTMFVKKNFKPGMKMAQVAEMWKNSDERKKAMNKEAPVEEKKKVRRPVVAPEAVITEAMPTRKVKRPIVAPTAVAVELPVRKIKKPVVAPSLVEIAPVVELAPKKIRKPKVAPITTGEIKKKD